MNDQSGTLTPPELIPLSIFAQRKGTKLLDRQRGLKLFGCIYDNQPVHNQTSRAIFIDLLQLLGVNHSPTTPCRMAMGERFKEGRAVSMVTSEPTTMIGNPHIRKNCQGKTMDRLWTSGQ